MVLTRPRRLPGFRFEVQAPPLADILPRMDIAVFVGFASAGPLHIPVAVESVARFLEIFGDDLPLAWDTQREQLIYAYLAPAVRDFFRNGGVRCWIIRVGGDASAAENARRPEIDFFPIPGLLKFQDGKLRPAFARARSPGAWFDAFEVSTALLSESFSGGHRFVEQRYSLVRYFDFLARRPRAGRSGASQFSRPRARRDDDCQIDKTTYRKFTSRPESFACTGWNRDLVPAAGSGDPSYRTRGGNVLWACP
jgi:hypothetical protein